MAAAAAVPGKGGARSWVLKLGSDEEKVKDGSELAGMV